MNRLESLTHSCDQMPVIGVLICSGAAYFDNDEDAWYLVVQRQATEADLEENHYLEQPGDIIWSTVVEIKFCPYCGSVLPNPRSRSTSENFGYYSHEDSSGWTSRFC